VSRATARWTGILIVPARKTEELDRVPAYGENIARAEGAFEAISGLIILRWRALAGDETDGSGLGPSQRVADLTDGAIWRPAA
jgi:hypothetical protein